MMGIDSEVAKRARFEDDPAARTVSACINTNEEPAVSIKSGAALSVKSSVNEFITRSEKLQYVMRPANVLPGLRVLPCVPAVTSTAPTALTTPNTTTTSSTNVVGNAEASEVVRDDNRLRPILGHPERLFRRKLVFPNQDDANDNSGFDDATPSTDRIIRELPAIVPRVSTALVSLGFGNRSCRILTALVLPNDLCVLVVHRPLKVCTLRFDHFDVSDVSGKKKKGAKELQAGSKICTLTYMDTETDGVSTTPTTVSPEGSGGGEGFSRYISCDLKTPVGGQVLELNRRLETHPELLASASTFQSVGYVAIIYPDTELPDFHTASSFATPDSIHRAYVAKVTAGRQCFAWAKTGVCTRGNLCKFEHNSVNNAAS